MGDRPTGREDGLTAGRAGVGREGRGEQQASQGGPGELHDAGRVRESGGASGAGPGDQNLQPPAGV